MRDAYFHEHEWDAEGLLSYLVQHAHEGVRFSLGPSGRSWILLQAWQTSCRGFLKTHDAVHMGMIDVSVSILRTEHLRSEVGLLVSRLVSSKLA